MRKRRKKASEQKAVKRLVHAKRRPTVRRDLSRVRAASVLQRLLILEPDADQTSAPYQEAISFLDGSLILVDQRQMGREKLAAQTSEERVEIALQVKYGFQHFVDSGHRSWRWIRVGPPLQLEQLEIVQWPRGGLRMMFHGPWPTGFWLSVASALEIAGDLLQRCPRRVCRRLFVKRGKQTHCSTACNNRDRSERHYRSNRDKILDRRHQRYVDKVRQEHAKARVLRRRRRA
jgi:hypothetical protein